MTEKKDQENFTKIAIATVLGVVILAGAVFIAYRYSQTQSSGIILPGGVTYLGPSPKPTSAPPTPIPKFTAADDVPWDEINGSIYPFSFSYPTTLNLSVFSGDKTDSVAINWADIPPQNNILLNIEVISTRNSKYTEKPKIEYVKDWHNFFSGIVGVKELETFTNSNNLVGYKVKYLNTGNESPNVDIFFEVPNNSDVMIHLANGVLADDVFDKIVDSVSWSTTKAAPKPTKIISPTNTSQE